MESGAGVESSRKISNFTAICMLGLAILMDLIQFLLTLTVFVAFLSEVVTVFALMIFGIWFAILGVNYLNGRKSLMKFGSVVGSAIVEIVPFLDAMPAITAGVLGVIVSTRLEERSDKKKPEAGANAPAISNRVRFGPKKIPSRDA